MNYGLSDRVREQARLSYIGPAVSHGKLSFSIPVKELLRSLEGSGFPRNHARQVCTALTSGKFLRENNVAIDAIDGPPSKNSTTVIVHYRFASSSSQIGTAQPIAEEQSFVRGNEAPEERVRRLTGKIRGILKEELAEYGGGEAFLRWVRGYDEEDAA